MSVKGIMNPQSLFYELDSSKDGGGGEIYPIIEPIIVAEQRNINFDKLQFANYIQAIMIVIEQNKLGNSHRPSITTTTYANIQKAQIIVQKSVLNN